MKQTSLILILTISLCLLISSCNHGSVTTSVLSEAEKVMTEYPDSALKLLQSIPNPEGLTGKAQADYALLYSQALDKNYIDTANDSLIQVAVNYYQDRSDTKARFYTYYYLGRVYVNGNQYGKATLAFMNAEQEVEGLGDDYAAGLLYTEMGDIYREYYDFPKALDCYQQSTWYYEKAGKYQHKLWGRLSQSAVYDAMGEKQKCYDLLCNIMSEAKNIGYSQMIRFCLGDLIIMSLKMERKADALNFYKELKENYSMEGFTPSFYASLGVLQARENNYSDAQIYLEKAWGLSEIVNDSIYVYHKASEIYLAQQKYEKAYSELENCVLLQNKEMLKALRQPVLTVQKEFLETELAYKQYRIKMERLVYILVGIIVVFVAVFVVSVLRKKLKKQEKTYQQKLANLQTEALDRERQLRTYTQELENKSALSRKDIERLTLELKISQEHIEKSRSFREEALMREEDLRSDLREQDNRSRALLNKLFKRNSKQLEETLYVLQKKYKNNDRRLNAIDEYILEIRSGLCGSRKANRQLEDLVNEYYDNAMVHLHAEVKLPDEKHYQLVCLLLLGLSVNLIASLTGETTNAIYKRRDKIREVIKHSNVSNQNVYLLL